MTLMTRLALILLAAASCAAKAPPAAPRLVESGKPTLSLSATPPMGFGRIVTLRATLAGLESQDWYCRPIEWTWPDGTRSTHTADCPPWAEHTPGDYERVWVRKIMLSAPGEYTFEFRLLGGDGRALAGASVKAIVAGVGE